MTRRRALWRLPCFVPSFNNVMHEYTHHIERLAAASVLLVGCDFDGTISALTSPPSAARPLASAVEVLEEIASLPTTHSAVISGRPLAELRERLQSDSTDARSRIRHVGSHGAEYDDSPTVPLAGTWLSLLDRVAGELQSLATKTPGAIVERKSRGVAFHTRLADAPTSDRALSAAAAIITSHHGLQLRHGSRVVEGTVGNENKGEAIARLRRICGASSVVFAGDDLTDEHAFLRLGPGDLSLKVGPGETVAMARVAEPANVVEFLVALLAARREHLRRHAPIPLNQLSVLSDLRTAALIAPDASLVWLCAPRVDSPPIFASLLDPDVGGTFSIEPIGAAPPIDSLPHQRAVADALIIATDLGNVRVLDYLDCDPVRAFQRAGRTDFIRVLSGRGRVRIRFCPRLDFGRVPTHLSPCENGLRVLGAPEPITLVCPGLMWNITTDGPHHVATCELDLRDHPVPIELRIGTSSDRPSVRPEAERRLTTARFWSQWTDSLRLPRIAPRHVRRAALLLRSLIHGPTGALAAAATTSLPEHLGGQRNWDYRYCWPRDAAMAAAALTRLGNFGTAIRFLDFLVRVIDRCDSPGRLRPLYAIDGSETGPEAEIGGLRGYAGSLPVRIGNAASMQVQLDVFGPITDLIARVAERGLPLSPDHWRITRAMVQAVSDRWQEPDHGIWEVRTEQSHHTHTKVMCHHTISRALVVQEHATGERSTDWATLAEKIRDEILANAYSPALGAFCGTYSSNSLDAAALSIGLTGLVSTGDPKFASTVDAINRSLREGNTVRRYAIDDGLPGREGGFTLCTGWLVEGLAACGRVEEAAELYRGTLACSGPTGTICEEHDHATNTPLGNVPQAYSLLAIINGAFALEAAGVDPRSIPDREGDMSEVELMEPHQ